MAPGHWHYHIVLNDEVIQRDVERGQQASVNQTPTVLITYKLKQQPWAQWGDYGLFRSYVDGLLTK